MLLVSGVKNLSNILALLVNLNGLCPGTSKLRLVPVRHNTLPISRVTYRSLLRPSRSVLWQLLRGCGWARAIRARASRPDSGACSLRVTLVENVESCRKELLRCLSTVPKPRVTLVSLGGTPLLGKCVPSDRVEILSVIMSTCCNGCKLSCVVYVLSSVAVNVDRLIAS